MVEAALNFGIFYHGSGRKVLKRLRVQNAQVARAGQRDDAVAFELGQAAGNVLDGKSEIVGDILPAHRKMDLTALVRAGRPVQQEDRNLLRSPPPAQQQRVSLSLR